MEDKEPKKVKHQFEIGDNVFWILFWIIVLIGLYLKV